MATTDVMLSAMTTVAEEAGDFNLSGIWISIGVLGGFVIVVLLYGFISTILGKSTLPPPTEDKEPLTPNEGEVASVKVSPDHHDGGEASGEVQTAAVAVDAEEPPPSYQQVAGGKRDVATTAALDDEPDLEGGSAAEEDGRDVAAVEVYEQDVDTTDEITRL